MSEEHNLPTIENTDSGFSGQMKSLQIEDSELPQLEEGSDDKTPETGLPPIDGDTYLSSPTEQLSSTDATGRIELTQIDIPNLKEIRDREERERAREASRAEVLDHTRFYQQNADTGPLNVNPNVDMDVIRAGNKTTDETAIDQVDIVNNSTSVSDLLQGLRKRFGFGKKPTS